MISHKHRCIFIHIPKCAGRSVEHAFISDSGITTRRCNLQVFTDFNILPDDKTFREEHNLPKQIGADHMLGEQYVAPSDYEIFTIVRNPLDRIASYYTWYGYKKHDSFESLCESLPFCTWWEYMMTRPQVDYLRNVKIDKIIHLEELATTGAGYFKNKFNIELPHKNRSADNIVKNINITEKAVEIVRDYFKEDFKYLQYE